MSFSSVGWFFPLLVVSFDEKNFLVLMWFNLKMFSFLWLVLCFLFVSPVFFLKLHYFAFHIEIYNLFEIKF